MVLESGQLFHDWLASLHAGLTLLLVVGLVVLDVLKTVGTLSCSNARALVAVLATLFVFPAGRVACRPVRIIRIALLLKPSVYRFFVRFVLFVQEDFKVIDFQRCSIFSIVKRNCIREVLIRWVSLLKIVQNGWLACLLLVFDWLAA